MVDVHEWETAGCSQHTGQSSFLEIPTGQVDWSKQMHDLVTKTGKETCGFERQMSFPGEP